MTGREFDTIVVGARVAGAPLATLLARAGQKVLLLDADKLPSDQPLSTHFVQPIGMDWLDELGVGARIRALAPPSHRLRLQLLGHGLTFSFPGGRAGCCVRRSVIDPLLQEAAVAAGAELRDRTEVVGLLREGERVVGVEARHGDAGKVEPLRARMVVGADGRNSTVAELTGAKEYLGYDNPRFSYWGYWPVPKPWTEDPELAGFDGSIEFARDRVVRFAFRCDGDMLMLCASPELSVMDSFRGNHQAAYVEALRGGRYTSRLVDGNQPVGPIIGVKKLRFFFRDAAGPGFALVGDAGLHKDPTPGVGMTDALRDARHLARAILEGGDGALRRYHLQRDIDSLELFQFAKDFGDPSYINPLNALVFERAATRPDIAERIALSVDRVIAPQTAIPVRDVARWTLGALLRGRFSVLPPFLAAGKRNSQIVKLRTQTAARLQLERG
jgi:flavin-dependent dehydrogenase